MKRLLTDTEACQCLLSVSRLLSAFSMSATSRHSWHLFTCLYLPHSRQLRSLRGTQYPAFLQLICGVSECCWFCLGLAGAAQLKWFCLAYPPLGPEGSAADVLLVAFGEHWRAHPRVQVLFQPSVTSHPATFNWPKQDIQVTPKSRSEKHPSSIEVGSQEGYSLPHS